MSKKPEKAKIQPLVPSGDEFEVLLNPNRYSISKSNQFSEVAIPGLDAPLLQFGRGNAQTLKMQLLFDTYDPRYSLDRDPNGTGKMSVEKNADVRRYTKQVTDLLRVSPDLHAPPVCQFSWGNLIFIGVLQQADVNFTLFLDTGLPVRATVDVTFKQYFDGTAQSGLFENKTKSSDRQSASFTKHYVIHPGDTLSHIAALHYEDPARWRPIAVENRIDDPRSIAVGDVLIIPPIE